MIIEKIVPIGSKNHMRWKDFFSNIGEKADSQGWIKLFTIWTLTVAGIVASMDFHNRYVYWEWDGWIMGSLKLMIVSIVFLGYLQPKKIWVIGTRRLTTKDILIHVLVASLLFIFGYINPYYRSEMGAVLRVFYLGLGGFALLYYILAFLSCLLVFQFTLELDEDQGTWNNFNWENKLEYLFVSVVLMCLSIFFSIHFEDPVASTSGAVALPFSAIALIWPNHVRHLQRARFYPLFTFAMFLCVRAPWFLVPLAVLFFLIRTVNYFRYGIVHPSFGVDFLEED